MHPMTKENLKSAFSGESQAHMKYLIFADKAEEEGFKNIARFFSGYTVVGRAPDRCPICGVQGDKFRKF